MGRESAERHCWPLRFLLQSLKLNIGFPQNSRFPYHTPTCRLHNYEEQKFTQKTRQIIKPTCWFAMICPFLGSASTCSSAIFREHMHIVRVSLLDSPRAPAILSTATPPPQQSSKIVATPPAAPRRRVRRVTPHHLWDKSWCGEDAIGISRCSKVKLLKIWNMWCLESGTI